MFEARDLKAVSSMGSTPYTKMCARPPPVPPAAHGYVWRGADEGRRARYLLPDKKKLTKKKTSPRKGTVNPFWEEEFRWQVGPLLARGWGGHGS